MSAIEDFDDIKGPIAPSLAAWAAMNESERAVDALREALSAIEDPDLLEAFEFGGQRRRVVPREHALIREVHFKGFVAGHA